VEESVEEDKKAAAAEKEPESVAELHTSEKPLAEDESAESASETYYLTLGYNLLQILIWFSVIYLQLSE